MKQELIGPTAALAGAMLSKIELEYSDFTRGIVAKTFEDAYYALLEGIQRVDTAEEVRHAAQADPPSQDGS